MKKSGWRLILFAKCEDTSEIASDELDGEVTTDRKLAARLHMAVCGPCRRNVRRMRWLERLLANAPASVRAMSLSQSQPPSLSDEAAERIRSALSAARDADTA